MSKKGRAGDSESLIKACYSTWGTRYYDDYYESDSAYPPVHTDIVRRILERAAPQTLLDAGCGPASMLRDLPAIGRGRYGFDLTPEMIAEARRVMALQDVPETHFWEGSVLDPDAFRGPQGTPAAFDAVICFGVLPHIPADSDALVFERIHGALAEGGLVAIEGRNQLFALFTLNRYSRNFFREALIREEALLESAGDEKEKVRQSLQELDERFRVDLPPRRKGYEDEPGYDEVLSRTHNPFEVMEAARNAGFRDVEVHFYHFHCLPPMFESKFPSLFRKLSVEMENTGDWRGYFMASAFILTGIKA